MPVVKSKRSTDVIALGKRLVEELGIHDSVDTPRKWLCHYLAELIEECESATKVVDRTVSQERCVGLILRLWENRDQLPREARPLGRLDGVLDTIRSLTSDKSCFQTMTIEIGERESPWLQFISESHAAHKHFTSIATVASLLDADFESEERWMVENGEQLDPREKESFELLDELVSSIATEVNLKPEESSLAQLAPKDREEALLEALGKCIAEQTAAFDRLNQSLKNPPRSDSNERSDLQ